MTDIPPTDPRDPTPSTGGCPRCLDELWCDGAPCPYHTTRPPANETAQLELDLSKSHYDGARKSCPECSRKAGQIVYLEPESFGTRIDTKTGETIMQSWCHDCRRTSRTPETP